MLNRRFLLSQRPQGLPTEEHVTYTEEPVKALKDGEILIKNDFISLDPAIRGWMDDVPSYLPPIALGDPVRATTIGKVVDSKNSEFKAGDLVLGLNGWEDYSVSTGFVGPNKMGVIEDTFGLPLEYFLSVLGPTGLTAYFGVEDILRPKKDQALVVSAAAGAVGSIVGQIAKIKGAKTIGLAGSEEKCQRLTSRFGFDSAINYHTNNLDAAIKEATPNGVDLYFDNVGGDILDTLLLNMNDFGRIAMCGMISQYNATEPVPGPYNMWQVVVKSLTLQGFLIRDYADRFGEAFESLAHWLNDGLIKHEDHVVVGLEKTLDSFALLFNGGNQGKLTIKVRQD
ncbi:MAG: NADP-dependent oxidoreductase [Pseudomonadales bacterium]|nr:NADP-dependent oxidoreductase [Pseudomonadales bacterium]